LCVPLILRGKVIGALEVLNKQDGDFDDQDVERGLSIAAAVAIAVSNALLFKEAESQKRHLETTLEYNNSPMLIMDENQNLMLLNQEARQRLGLTTEAVGKPFGEVVKIPELNALLDNSAEPISEEGAEITLADGSIWLPRFAPIPGHGYILVLQDIMGLKQLEMAKDEFVASLTHDMRAPLNTINGFATTLSQAGPLNEEQQLFVDRILDATDHMTEMVNGLLELAKVNTKMQHEYQPCDLVAITKEVVDEFLGQAMTNKVKLDMSLQTEKGMVLGDSGQLRSAVSNLVDNAIKYSPADETVKVVVSNENDQILVTVIDRGMGIDQSDLPHIFEKFYRGRDNHDDKGSGLGLALVHSIAKSHKGKVWAESNHEQGSQFSLKIPAIP
ncbi:MAG: ATP-binding protein, partial [Anaerolineae bacterium]